MGTSNENFKDALTTASEWYTKIRFIKDQTNKLEQLSSIPIIQLSVFLIKSQLVEFELKHLFPTLDAYLNEQSNSSLVTRNIRSSISKDYEKTLGQLIQELNGYNGDLLDPLKKDLEELRTIRNLLVHRLLAPGNLLQVIAQAEKGVVLANKVLEEIQNIDNSLR